MYGILVDQLTFYHRQDNGGTFMKYCGYGC